MVSSSKPVPAEAWHVVCTTVGRSIDVARELSHLNGFSPLYEVTSLEKRGLKRVTRALPVFPRYTFACWDGTDAHLWHDIHDVKGVTSILGGDVPLVVRGGEIEAWRARADENWVVPDLEPVVAAAQLGLNCHVRITAGPYEGRTGQIDSWDAKKLQVGVKLSLLGRPLVVAMMPSVCELVEETETDRDERLPLTGLSRSRSKNRRINRLNRPKRSAS